MDVDDVYEFNTLWGDDGFAKKYCGAFKSKWGWDVKGATNLDELENKLREHIMIRRRKEDVLDELPDKRRMVVRIDISNRSEYDDRDKSLREYVQYVQEEKGVNNAEVLDRIEKLRQLAWRGKYEMMIDWIEEAIKQHDKIVIWAHHKDLQKKLYYHYEDIAVHITGGMSTEQRQDVIDSFTNDDDVKVCVASIRSGGVAINLQVSPCAIFTELLWTPADHLQAEDRVHRIGQEHDYVDIYYLIGNDTIEEEIYKLMNSKQVNMDKAIDGKMDVKGMLADEMINYEEWRKTRWS